MKKENLIIILASVSCVLSIVAIVLGLNNNYFKLSNSSSEKENNSSLKEEMSSNDANNKVEDNKKDNDKHNNKDDIINNNDNSSISNGNDNANNNESTNVKTDAEDKKTETNKQDSIISSETYDEESVVSFFKSSKDSIGTNQEDKTLREKAKDAFTTIVDFIFYDKEIKGYTFNELTTKAKLEVIELALTIDHKIDNNFPDYKETIKDKYTNIKGKLAVKYLEFTSKLCDTVGSDTCNQAKEDFNTMKESFGFTWQLIKELASSGSSKIKEFYESWKDSK